MRIVIFGLPYSANVGDGVIADCLSDTLRRARPDLTIDHIDLSGRQGFGARTLRNRERALFILARLPLWMRQRLVIWRLGRLLAKLRPDWQRRVQGADLAIIGGGQLFSDADLNFCLKIAQAADVLAAAGVPVAVHGVGVSRNWTARGSALFSRLFATDLRAVGLRDAPSRDAWTDQTGALGPAPGLTRDPGLLAADCYGAAPQKTGGVGLCVTSPMILSYHADSGVAGSTGIGFFVDLARALVARGQSVALFCNGATEDRAALADVAGHPDLAAMIAGASVSVLPAPDTPDLLAHVIAGFEGVIAHRLHACILAYAYRVPCVGLGWDRKLESFFASVDHPQFFVGKEAARPDSISALCAVAMETGVDTVRHAQVLAETRAQAVALLDLVTAPPPEPTSGTS